MPLPTDLFDYHLPERLIAQVPAQRRDESRLLVVDRQTKRIEHRHFRDLPEYLRAGDTLFRNNAAVIPARLHATRPTGGAVECLLLRPAQTAAGSPRLQRPAGNTQPSTSNFQPSTPSASRSDWWCLLRPGKKLPVGATFALPGAFTGTVLEKTEDGLARVSFETTDGDILAVANRIGEMPLPPYIERGRSLLAGDEASDSKASPASRLPQGDPGNIDRERYQTVYADRGHQVAAAAPTAGLHFTPELLAKVAAQGIAFADLTLHVGLGTFRPITADTIEDHAIHREVYEIPAATQRALLSAGGRRIAVGTTSVRSIEDYLSRAGSPALQGADARERQDWMAEASIYIYPPRTFRGVDALITNFHQPRSTLLCLVSAFLTPGSTDGIAWLKEIYAEAVAREYRFFSYGDAMLIH